MQRLKTRAQFQAVMAGTTVSRTAHFALHRLALDAPAAFAAGRKVSPAPADGSTVPVPLFGIQESWVGALVPKRWAKRAVTRNAIKRQIYSLSRTLDSSLPSAAHVVRLRATFDREQFSSATSEALKRAGRGELPQLFARAAT